MEKIINKIVETLDKNKGEDIKVIDVSKNSPICDYVVICSVNNQKHINSLIEKSKKALDEVNHDFKSVQGKGSNWSLIDANDILIHIFHKDDREKYKLEDLLIKNEENKEVKI